MNGASTVKGIEFFNLMQCKSEYCTLRVGRRICAEPLELLIWIMIDSGTLQSDQGGGTVVN